MTTENVEPGDVAGSDPAARDERAPDGPLGVGGLIAGSILFVVLTALSALVEVMLVPLRVGTWIVPAAVVLAVVSNVVVPRLAHAATGSVGVAGLSVAVWMIVVLLLSQSRPEGDVLLPGGRTGIVYVVYATMLAGLITGLATVVLLGRRTGRVAAR